ncbi:MAG: hypothetical protein SPI59_03975 [Finegoldia sp.]|nr:hypothetical protein [Finegoldia sp.]
MNIKKVIIPIAVLALVGLGLLAYTGNKLYEKKEERIEEQELKAQEQNEAPIKEETQISGEDGLSDKLSVYDKDGKEVMTYDKDEDLKGIAENLLDGAKTEEDIKAKLKELKTVRKLPKDAEVAYEYSVELDPERDLSIDKVDLTVYKNYPYVTVKDMPFFGNVNLEIPDDVYQKITNPENLTN